MSDYFVPVAVDKQKLVHAAGSRERYGDERRIIDLFTGGKSGDLAVYLLTPAGQSLTNKQIFRMQSAGDVLSTLQEAVAEFGPVAPRRAIPAWQPRDKGVGLRPDGSVRLAASVRHTDRTDYRARPVFDSIVLTKEQFDSLTPAGLEPGTRHTLPDSTARQFSRMLSASSDLSNMIRPSDLTVVELTVTVSDADQRQLSLSGRLAGSRRYVNGNELIPGQAQVAGLIQLDADDKPVRLLFVFEGTYKLPWDGADRPTGAIVEWSAASG